MLWWPSASWARWRWSRGGCSARTRAAPISSDGPGSAVQARQARAQATVAGRLEEGGGRGHQAIESAPREQHPDRRRRQPVAGRDIEGEHRGQIGERPGEEQGDAPGQPPLARQEAEPDEAAAADQRERHRHEPERAREPALQGKQVLGRVLAGSEGPHQFPAQEEEEAGRVRANPAPAAPEPVAAHLGPAQRSPESLLGEAAFLGSLGQDVPRESLARQGHVESGGALVVPLVEGDAPLRGDERREAPAAARPGIADRHRREQQRQSRREGGRRRERAARGKSRSRRAPEPGSGERREEQGLGADERGGSEERAGEGGPQEKHPRGGGSTPSSTASVASPSARPSVAESSFASWNANGPYRTPSPSARRPARAPNSRWPIRAMSARATMPRIDCSRTTAAGAGPTRR